MKFRVPMYLRTVDYDGGYVIVEADNADEARLIVREALKADGAVYDEIVWDKRPDQVDAGVDLDPFEPTTLVEEYCA